MYKLYEKHRLKGNSMYRLQDEEVHLFGHEGHIRRLLAKQAPIPYEWHLDIQGAFAKTGNEGLALVIDLKPKQKKENVSLYELFDVWGSSYEKWTPILLRLRALAIDADPKKINREKFCVPDGTRKEAIYEVLYVNGGILRGKLTGSWSPPPASPTNGALLWPPVVKYFVSCIQERTPEVLGP